MAKSASPTSQQSRVLNARQDHPDKTAAEIGELLGISPGAVFQAESRLRRQGHLPNLRRKGRRSRKAGRPRRTTPVPTVRAKASASAPPSIALDNGDSPNGRVSDSVEQMIADEIATMTTRITAIEQEQARLDEERTSKAARLGRLEGAQKQLVGSSE